MRLLPFACLLLSCSSVQAATQADPLAPIGLGTVPPPVAARPVTETIFGESVTDPYRYFEALGPATIGWMKAENAYTRTILDAIKPRAAFGKDLAAYTDGFSAFEGYLKVGGREFFELRAPGSDNFDLMVRDAAGTRRLVDMAALRRKHGGAPYAINYFLPSPDGAKVAVGISPGGSENATISTYDAASGKAIGGTLDRAEFGATAWSEDGKYLYVIRLKQLAKGETAIDKYKDSTLVAWDGHSAALPILGDTVGHGPAYDPIENPALTIVPGAPMAAAINQNGVQNEIAISLAPVSAVNDPKVVWTPFVARQDGITAIDMRGDQIFLLSHKNAPAFQVLQVTAGQALSTAKIIVPAKPDRVIDAIHAAKDALYVLARSGAYSTLLRVPFGTSLVETVPLPFKGHIDDASADPRVSGIDIALNGWVVPPTEFHYDPPSYSFADLKLGQTQTVDPAHYTVSDLNAPALDGVQVPLSLIRPAGVTGPGIVLLDAYGSYGISELADFSARTVFLLDHVGSFGVCHVRGGGELGEAWRLGGKDANKHNTWQDLIACGGYLVAQHVTTPDKLFIIGGSAGGITMGRALTERPDLFAGVIDEVPSANTLRAEFSPNGPNNIPEFGTITDQQGFSNLRAMDSIQHVQKGTQYPAVMITTGLNDPRVSPWEPAKFTAALQASGTAKPILLRVETQAGHGIGSTKSQADQAFADICAFIQWRAGTAGWRPSK